jgi:hypothetical protein
MKSLIFVQDFSNHEVREDRQENLPCKLLVLGGLRGLFALFQIVWVAYSQFSHLLAKSPFDFGPS